MKGIGRQAQRVRCGERQETARYQRLMRMRRGLRWPAGVALVIAAAGCGSGASTSVTFSHQGHKYRDAAGWSVEVPPGWHSVQFSDSAKGITSAGVQLSNVPLPPPSLVPGFPVQVNNRVLPAHGVGLIIATDTDPKLSRGLVAAPPLSAPNGRHWMIGSAPAGWPHIELLWFRAHGRMLIASVKIGPKASDGDVKTIAMVVQSFH